MKLNNHTILVRGAGELASAVALTLHRTGFPVLMTELPIPLAIRRTVCFSEAMLNGTTEVEGIHAIRVDNSSFIDILKDEKIPVLVDSIDIIKKVKPEFYIDARLLKETMIDRRSLAKMTIGLGPGFRVGSNCNAIIETLRGHNLGNVIWDGSAQPNTGVPGKIGGESAKRVIHSPTNGRINWLNNIGDLVENTQLIGNIADYEIKSQISGMIRGLISPKVDITKGLKIADIDPRGNTIDFKTISDKSRCVGRGVLEAIMVHLNK